MSKLISLVLTNSKSRHATALSSNLPELSSNMDPWID